MSTALRSLACLVLASTAGAQVLHVRAGAPGGNGSSWSRAIPDLSAALALAGSTPTTEVWVAAGRYTPHAFDRTVSFAVPDGVAVYGGFAGNETSLDQRDPAANATVLDGDLAGDDQPGFVNYGDNSHHVVTSAGSTSFALDGFTVRGGSLGGGAGLRVACFQATLANLEVVENQGLGNNNDAGGLWATVNFLDVTRCRFADNTTTAGGAVHLYDAASPGGNAVTFTDCTFEDNSTGSSAGIKARGAGGTAWNLALVRCVFRRGFSTSGGALTMEASSDEHELRVSGCLFEDNAACAGGALFLVDTDTLVEDSSFVSNGFRGGCGTGSGGGAIKQVGGSLVVASSAFVRNARNALLVESGGSATAMSSTFLNDAQASIRVTSGTLDLDSCILWGSVATQLVVSASGSFSASHCDVRMDGAGLPGTGNFELDPQFVDAAAGDVHLAAGSPCVDAGNPATFGVGADFERDSRILDGDLDGVLRLDVGADEHGPLHLEVLGVPAPGSTLTFVTSGPPMLVVLYAGLPGARFVPRAGTFFLNSAGMLRASWPPPPSSVPVPVSASVIGLFHVQQLGAAGGGAFVLSNYVPLQF